jgi:putative hydrolase of the HAD superfamily
MRGVLFDAGGVLIRPVGGRWNPRYDFESIIASHHPSAVLSPAAVEAGRRLLDGWPGTAPRAAYHRAVLAAMGVDDPSPELLRELEAPSAGLAVALFPDVLGVLDQLRARGIRMSVVSDNWAGMAATRTSWLRDRGA